MEPTSGPELSNFGELSTVAEVLDEARARLLGVGVGGEERVKARAGVTLRARARAGVQQPWPGSRSAPGPGRETSLPISQYLGGDAETVLLRLCTRCNAHEAHAHARSVHTHYETACAPQCT